MFDNLIARAIVPVTIAVTGFVIFVCILLYSFVKSDMTAEAMRSLDNCAGTVVKSARHAMMEDDRRAIQNIVTNIGTRSDVGLLKIYDGQGNVRYTGREEPEALAATIESNISGFLQADTSTKVTSQYNVDHSNGYISVSLPIPNEPQCSTGACHFHDEDERYLGFLSIGVSSENLENTLALLRYRMIIFSVMVLFLTVGGVTALLRVNLFMPILRLTYNAEQAVQGVSEPELPKSDHKLGKLNKDFRLLVKQRDQAWQDLKAVEDRDSKINDGTDDSRIRSTTAGHQSTTKTGSSKNQEV